MARNVFNKPKNQIANKYLDQVVDLNKKNKGSFFNQGMDLGNGYIVPQTAGVKNPSGLGSDFRTSQIPKFSLGMTQPAFIPQIQGQPQFQVNDQNQTEHEDRATRDPLKTWTDIET